MTTSQPYTEHEKYANQADDYLDQHNVYELFGNLLRKLVIHKPKDPISFMIHALEQPVQQLRVLLVSPPSPTTATLISSVVRDLGLIRLRLSTIIQEAIASDSPLGKQAKSYVDADQELPDSLLIPLIAARTNQDDAIGTGWILEGYPTTRVQALALQAGGILPTHVLYFTNPPAAAKPVDGNNEEEDPAVVAANEVYKRHGAAVQEVFSPVAHFVDLSKPVDTLQKQLVDLFNTPPRSHAPKRPMRLIILGPRGSGRHTQAELLAQKYGLVHVNPTALLKQEVKKTPALQQKIQQYLTNGLLVPDEIITPLIISRLLSSDVKAKGFVLDGFPRTPQQCEALTKASITPNRVVILAVSEEECRARISGRRLDPETGDEYNLKLGSEHDLSNLPSAIRDRLIHASNDQTHTLDAINFAYSSFIDEIKQSYAKVVKEIPSTLPAGKKLFTSPADINKSKQQIFEQIEDFVLAPLHNQYAHAAAKKAKTSEKPANGTATKAK